MPFQQFDLAKAYSDAEIIKGARQENALAKYAFENKKTFNALAPLVAGGDQGAYNTALSVDPSGALALRQGGEQESAGKMKAFANVAGWVLSLPPEQRAAAWSNTARGEVQKIFGMDPNAVPADYDEQKLQAIYARVSGPQSKGEAFTLSPGQTRYGPDGRPVAAAPAAQPKVDGFTLGPGQSRFGPDGKPIAAVAPTEKPPATRQFITVLNRGTGEVRTLDKADTSLDSLFAEGWVAAPLSVNATSPGDLSPSGNKMDEIRSDLNAVTRARDSLANIRQSIVSDRSRAGVAGTVKRVAQETVGIVLDLAEMGVDVPGFVKNAATSVAEDINLGKAEPSIATLFDPSIPQNEVFQNGLAYALARARKGSGRLNQDDVDNARNDVRITGLTRVDAVMSRLDAIDRELANAASDMEGRMGGKSDAKPPRYRFNADTGGLERVE